MGVTGSRAEPFLLLEPRVAVAQPLKYTVYDAVCNADGSECSVFKIEPGESEMGIALAANFLRSWKVYRHPVIAPFIESYEENGVTYVVTERLLEFDSESLSVNERAWALNNMARLVSFLSESAHVVHGNLGKGALFLTPGRELKVSGLQWVSAVANASGVIEQFRAQWQASLPFKMDTGEEWNELFDCQFIGMYLSEWKASIPKPFLKFEKLWKTSTPKVGASKFLELEYWENDKFVQYLTFLRELPLKDPFDREVFLKNLLDNIDNFDRETQNVAILPCLISALSYSPTPSLLGPILTIGRNLDEKRFAIMVVPQLVSLFENKDRALRIHLLSEIEALVPFLDQNVANSQIFDNVVGGLNDVSPQLRQATIIAMAPLAQFLTQDHLSVLVRELRRLQIDNDAQIRTNAVICIAKIAGYLDSDTRGQVLAACFAKSVIDPYVPARRAAIAAFKNCLKYFTNYTVAHSVIPAVAPLCVDQNAEVKEAALNALQIFLNVLKGEVSLQSAATTPLKPIQRVSPAPKPTTQTASPEPAKLPLKKSTSSPGIKEQKPKVVPEKPPPRTIERKKTRDEKPMEVVKSEEVVDGWSDEDFDFDEPDEPVIEEPKKQPVTEEPKRQTVVRESAKLRHVHKEDPFDDDDGWDLDSPWSDEEKVEEPKPVQKKPSKFIPKPARTGKKND